MEGMVKNIVVKRGFGFITSGKQEYFFHKDDFYGHWDNLLEDVFAQQRVPVEFEVKESPKGPRASNVRRTDHPN